MEDINYNLRKTEVENLKFSKNKCYIHKVYKNPNQPDLGHHINFHTGSLDSTGQQSSRFP